MTKEEQIKYLEDNYPLYTKHSSIRRTRHDIFKNIATEIQAYLLGFYVADGSVDQKRKTFRVKVQEDDAEIIYLLKDFICPDARIFSVNPYEITGRNEKTYIGKKQIGIDISSKILVDSLVYLGYGYKKTYLNIELPKLEDELLIHFIRGYFDGDGSFSGNVRIDPGKSPRKVMKFSIFGKNRLIFDQIQQFFLKYDINTNIYYTKRDDMYLLNTSSIKEIKKIYKLFYENCNFCLNRKFKKIDYYVNTEVSQIIIDHRNAQEMNVNESNNSPTSAGPLTHNGEGENIC